MKTYHLRLQELFSEAIQRAFPAVEMTAEITQSTQAHFGHYQCNNGMKIGQALRQNPRAAAQALVDALQDSQGLIEKVEIAGPGFINIHLKPEIISKELTATLHDPRLGVPLPGKRQKIIVEFSSPNVAKELHVGHLRSTIIGDALARLFEFLGHDVLRLNHIGDWGTQFGMLIAYLKAFQPEVLAGTKEAALPDLMQWYRDAKKHFDADPDFKKRSQEEVVTLQAQDPESIHAWNKICDISRRAYQEIYDLLDIKLIERGESFYNPYLKGVVEALDKKGMLTVSDGAKCVFVEGFTTQEGEPLPAIIQKSDGGYNYTTTDLATLRHRVEVEKADRIIHVVDAGQSLHFQMFFKVAERAGWLDPKKTKIEHVAFGVVLGADGKKFKTRSGETERLIDLLTTAIDKAREILSGRLPDATPEEIKGIATALGIDAVKYADLSGHRIKDYAFSYDRMLRFEGNTAAFLLYAFVRIEGIKRKVGKRQLSGNIHLAHPSEITLGLHLRQFPEALESVDKELLPHRLCDYLFILAEKFNAFYRDCPVEGAAEAESRLLLCEATQRILAKGLDLLGLKTVSRM